jgi:UDP-N-acetyl-2-amino-2-deoxyglucuronate dehydrogenase
LRLHPAVLALKQRLEAEPVGRVHDVCLTYVTRRGAWYDVSWKGSEERSGGLAMNIGVHFFDLLLWLFGRVHRVEMHVAAPRRMAGLLRLDYARVRWLLSVDERDLPDECRESRKFAYRSMTVDGEEVDLSSSFTDLHTRVYEGVLAGEGFGIEDARPAIDLVHAIRHQRVVSSHEAAHPMLVT